MGRIKSHDVAKVLINRYFLDLTSYSMDCAPEFSVF